MMQRILLCVSLLLCLTLLVLSSTAQCRQLAYGRCLHNRKYGICLINGNNSLRALCCSGNYTRRFPRVNWCKQRVRCLRAMRCPDSHARRFPMVNRWTQRVRCICQPQEIECYPDHVPYEIDRGMLLDEIENRMRR